MPRMTVRRPRCPFRKRQTQILHRGTCKSGRTQSKNAANRAPVNLASERGSAPMF